MSFPYGRSILWVLIIVVVLLVTFAVMEQLVWFWLNVLEFGGLFIRPIYFEFLGGLILAAFAFFRLDFKNRKSLFWWAIKLILRLMRKEGLGAIPSRYIDFKTFKMSPGRFAAWQVTKVIVGTLFFRNMIFGMTMYSMIQGWEIGIEKIWKIFSLPFVTPSMDLSYANTNVIPLIPSLTLIIPPFLRAIEFRLIILVILTQLVCIITQNIEELKSKKFQVNWRVSTIEALIALGLFWITIKSFFSSFIDYNTKIIIGALIILSGLFAFFSYLDGYRKKRLLNTTIRSIILRALTIFVIILLAGSVIAIQNSIADARKVEWRGPYTAQQIAVNRYLAELDNVKEILYDFGIKPISLENIQVYVSMHEEILSKIRLWDWQAAFAKLKPEIGLIPYIDFQDSDILRFENNLYWSASMKPILPITVRPEDKWYAQHLVYTHVPAGFLILDAHTGKIIETERFFKQRKVYYGEGGLFSETWSAFPINRKQSEELEGHFYNGEGGINISPPLSWLFDPVFFWSYMGETIHVMRYRDVYDRMKLLFPYFEYQFEGKNIDILPVTDGTNTYWLIPLIIRLNGENIPWSIGNPFMRLVGYALIDIYHGKIQLIILGNDYFSELFKKAYSEYIITEIPDWLKNQLRYPEELFEWKVSMYNFFHVTDPATFIVAKEFFEVPKGLDTYYIITKLPGFEKFEYIGILSLELRGAGGRNLAGYMIVRNDYENFGEMIFYKVDINSPTKLLGPTAVLEAMEKNPDFAKLKTLLREPRIGDIIFYRIGDYDVYFIPVYTAGTSGVVAELGTIVTVGAAFTGKYYVGLGNTIEESFKAFLIQLSGLETQSIIMEIEREQKLKDILKLFEDNGLIVVKPKAIYPTISFQEGEVSYISKDHWDTVKELINSFIKNWCKNTDKILMWTENSKINFGILINIKGIIELHYITISLEE
ncbi:MAG: UPF0182 family protein [Nitrososphaerota archaeon]